MVDESIVEEIRARAVAGVGACEIAAFIQQRSGADAPRLLTTIAYFRAAFGLSLGDAKGIGAAPIFGLQSLRTAHDVDVELGALLEKAKPWPRGDGS